MLFTALTESNVLSRPGNGFQDNRLIPSVGIERDEELVMVAAYSFDWTPHCGGQSRMPPLTILQAFLVPLCSVLHM